MKQDRNHSKKQYLQNGQKIIAMLLICLLLFGTLVACAEKTPEETADPAGTTEEAPKTPESEMGETGETGKTPESETGEPGKTPEGSVDTPQTPEEQKPLKYYVPTSGYKWYENRVEQYIEGILYYEAEFDDNGNLTKKIQYDIYGENEEGRTDYVTLWIEYKYDYDEAGRIAKKTEYNEDGTLRNWKEFTYDGDGNLILEEKYRSDGKRDTVTEYRADGQELKYTQYSDGKAYFSISYTYDPEGHLLSERRSGAGWADYNRVYEYNEDGKLIRYTYYDGMNRVELCETFEYSAGKRRRESTWYDNDGTTTVTSGEAEYDDAGRCIKSTYYEEDGSLGGWYEHEYDDAGNHTKETQYASDGSVSHVWSCEYMEVTAAQYKALKALGELE